MKKIILSVLVLCAVFSLSWFPSGEKITIEWDEFGTPHISCATDYGVFFGAGWAQATDHLEEMLLVYKMARGETSEVLGAGYNELDEFVLMLDSHNWCRGVYSSLPCEVVEMCEGFVDGVNSYMRAYPDRVPEWAEPVEVTDPLAVARVLELGWTASTILGSDIFSISPASNEWVISTEKSSTGNSFVQADPHLPLMIPFKLSLYHMKGETFEVNGPCLFGVPVPIMGHNRNVGWAMTSNAGSFKSYDIYALELDDTGRNYRFGDRWMPLVIREKTLTHTDDTTKTLTTKFTHFGPVYETFFGSFCVRISGWNVPSPLTQSLDMAKAEDVYGFFDVMKQMQIGQWNYAVSDTKGNIGYLFNAICPKYSGSGDILDGTKPEKQWISYYSFDELPKEINPECGWIENCNEAPWYCCPETNIKKEDFTYINGYRNRRSQLAWRWLESNDAFDRDTLESMVTDSTYIHYDDFMSWFEENSTEIDDTLKGIVKRWDGRFDADSDTAFYAFPFVQAFENEDNDLSEIGENLQIATNGDTPVKWGDAFKFKKGNESFPVSAAPINLQSLHYAMQTKDGESLLVGSAFQMLMEMSIPPKAWVAHPFSQSEDENSPHFSDGTKLWCEGILREASMDGYKVISKLELVAPYRQNQ
ncbi:MAG TPA: penicillin acylase family protein [Caldisericia bacterium]|nr:penicillin acylase family protein [Caldisericia bacterium]HPF48576.1 penicillin acylase family protein [Caldisericia bacterium]HPI83764.1 penicillin acylase family protein [Caldisericia bacterium]HPQ93031.1 penicillin acylase family protein [Caldisericia bacterium]HRV75136.1 penicillin acylase family protein [Caldisericia bacterium]